MCLSPVCQPAVGSRRGCGAGGMWGSGDVVFQGSLPCPRCSPELPRHPQPCSGVQGVLPHLRCHLSIPVPWDAPQPLVLLWGGHSKVNFPQNSFWEECRVEGRAEPCAGGSCWAAGSSFLPAQGWNLNFGGCLPSGGMEQIPGSPLQPSLGAAAVSFVY